MNYPLGSVASFNKNELVIAAKEGFLSILSFSLKVKSLLRIEIYIILIILLKKLLLIIALIFHINHYNLNIL
jgi:hypothetical protein